MDVLGIDISKADFHCCLIQNGQRHKRSFPNVPTGARQLRTWLRNRKCERVHACMEATGAYWSGLATALYDAGMVVSVVNPSRTAFFARSQLRRTKTDLVDCAMIADFAVTQNPATWSPPAQEIVELRGFLTYRDHLMCQQIRIKHVITQVHAGKALLAFHARELDHVQQSIKALDAQLAALLEQQQHLKEQVNNLTAVKGIGTLTALSIIAKLPVDRLRDGKAAAAYVGLTPRERQSGTSLHAHPRISKIGNASLRRDLYMPALVAMRYNPIIMEFSARLAASGKKPKVIIVAVMRKLIVLAYTILTRGLVTQLNAA